MNRLPSNRPVSRMILSALLGLSSVTIVALDSPTAAAGGKSPGFYRGLGIGALPRPRAYYQRHAPKQPTCHGLPASTHRAAAVIHRAPAAVHHPPVIVHPVQVAEPHAFVPPTAVAHPPVVTPPQPFVETPLASSGSAGSLQPSDPRRSNEGAQIEQSALRMLAAIKADEKADNVEVSTNVDDEAVDNLIPKFQPAPVAAGIDAGHLGTWRATLPGNSSVVLELSGGDVFRWTAISGGKTSTFEGTFEISADRLKLIRSSDNGQLVGSWTRVGSQSTDHRFKLDGSQDDGLVFRR